jgi:hypothetical protein
MYHTTYLKQFLYKIVLLATILLVSSASFCQDDLNTLATSFNRYFQHINQEKLFVQTDKSFYVAGEILWFKIYSADITSNKPLDISKVVYTEILDTTNKPVLQAKTGMSGGNGNGSFYLPLTLHSGNYKLRAYTNWMKNEGPDCFFEKIITIVNVQRITEQPASEASTTYNIQFFPEGGNLVAGLESKVAFKVWDNNGKGVSATGTILDNGNTVTTFSTSHAGMGSFNFKPASNHTYKAVIQKEGGKTITKGLPSAYSTGMVMHISNDADNVNVRIQSNDSSSDAVYLIVHSGSSIKLAEKGILQNGSTTFRFNQSLVSDGVSHFTVFNENRQPLCERLYFKKPAAYLNIASTFSESEYEKRSKVNITIASPSLTIKDSAMLSMAVYRLDSIQSIDENTINTYLLLSSELKGYIEDIQYYFGEGKQNSEDLDNLLLINGWRRFNWENVFSSSKPMFTYVPEFNGHIITGKVMNSKTGKGEKEIETYLSVPGLRTEFVPTLSENDGSIKFEMKDFFGSSEIIAQTKEQSDKYRIQINNPFSTAYSTNPVPLFRLPGQYPNTLNEQSISMQVQNIYSLNKLNQFDPPIIDTAAFYLSPDSKYNLEDYTRFTTIEEILREYVILVNLTKHNGKYHIQVFDKGNQVPFTEDPLVLLDGVPVLNLNKLLNVDPLKLRSLEVVQKKYFLGPTTSNGILNWKSYNGDMADYELDPSAVIMDYEGLQLKREFYAPEYNNDKSSSIPDFRNVLYWNPNIKLFNNKEQTLSFYTSDLPGKYAVVIQGISSTGFSGSTINTFEVKE